MRLDWRPIVEIGIVVNLLLGILWALGCLIFVVFLFEFREDMFVHPIYPSSSRGNVPDESPHGQAAARH
jgi:hypothetical protein